MKRFNLNDLADYNNEVPVRRLVHEDTGVRVLLLCFKAGQRVEPCVMERDVLFYTVQGKGIIKAEGRTAVLQPGVMVAVPRKVERIIEAEEDLLVIGIQTG